MKRIFVLVFMLLVDFTVSPSIAQDAPPAVSEVEIEQRAREIGRGLRCVMCKNESIEESPSTTAQDMRRIVRDRVRSGETDAEIIDYMQSRYGDFILLKPPVQPNTYLLWALPFLLLILALGWFWRAVRKYSTDQT